MTGQVFQNEYGRYAVPAGLDDRPAVKRITAGKVYEPQTLAFMREHAGDGDIIHAGTFFGDFIPALSTALAPGATLWAFEPNPVSHAHAAETIALNDLANVRLANAALSDWPGELLFCTHDEAGAPLGGLAHLVETEAPGVTRVAAAMLDYAVPLDRPVSILQLDVEGHERPALLGAWHLINRWRPILVLEAFDKLRWLNRHFPGLDYRRLRRLHANSVYVPAGHPLDPSATG